MSGRTGFQIGVLIFFGGMTMQGSAECFAPTSYTTGHERIPQVTDDIAVDGVLDDVVWQTALQLPLAYETFPAENQPAPVKTTVYLAENAHSLLIAFRAEDPRPSAIRAFLRDRDRAYDDDFVGVVLDTFNDERQAYEFFVNPLGAQMDLILDDANDNETDSWDAIWDSAGRITSSGFNVEMKIPLQQLRFPETAGAQTWGVDALRFYPRDKRLRLAVSPKDRNRNCQLCQLKKIEGFPCAKPGKNLVVAPTLTTVRADIRDDVLTAPLVQGDLDFEPGVDLRWGVTPDMTLSGTLNPDFSQVEADVAQLDVNNTFALFFPEKRPFFLDGAEMFSTPIQAVFTRSVADPDVGLKVIGKQANHNYGLFYALDAQTSLLFPGNTESDSELLQQDNQVLVGRYRYDIGNKHNIGTLLTHRTGDDYQNSVAGVDGRFRFTDEDTLRVQYLLSQTEYPNAIVSGFGQPAGQFTGHALSASFRHRTRNWNYKIARTELDRNFRADSGFITRNDINRWVVGSGYTWFRNDNNWNEISLYSDWDITHADDGTLLERELEAYVSVKGPMQSFLEIGAGVRDRFFDNRLFDENYVTFYGEAIPVAGLQTSIQIVTGDQVDFTNSQLGEELRVRPAIDFNVGKHFLVRLRHTYSTLDTTTGEPIFTANQSDMRFTYQFDVRSFLRLVIQHTDVERNPVTHVEEVDTRSRFLGTQLLYSYKVNPQTVLFVGYSDAAEDGDALSGFTRSNRTFFAKIGYAWLP